MLIMPILRFNLRGFIHIFIAHQFMTLKNKYWDSFRQVKRLVQKLESSI